MADEILTTQPRILIWVGAFLRSVYWVSEYVFVMVAIHVIYAYWFEPSMLKLRIGLLVLDVMNVEFNHGLATFISILQLAFVWISIFIQRNR